MSSAEAGKNRTILLVVYGLYVLSIFLGVSAIVGVIIAYVRLEDVSGTWLESHARHQIRIFWGFVTGVVVSVLLIVSVILSPIGIALLVINYVVVLFRIISGGSRLFDNKAIGTSTSNIEPEMSPIAQPTLGSVLAARSPKAEPQFAPREAASKQSGGNEEGDSEDEFPFQGKNDFRNVADDVSDESREVLERARSLGFDVRLNRRANYVAVTRGDFYRRFYSNDEIFAFQVDLAQMGHSP